MENKIMKIVVTGSLGHIGRPLTEKLLEKGHQVAVITKDAQKQKEIEALGARALVGSVEDADFLSAATAGADALFAMIPPNFAAPDAIEYYRRIGRNYARAVSEAGVGRVVHLSSWGAHLSHGTGFIVGSHEVENILDALTPAVSVTNLRPGSFYYNLYSFAETIKTRGVIASNYGGSDKIVMAAPEDIAEAAAEELQTSAAAARKVRYIGSDDLTGDEAARTLGAAIGRPDLQWITLTDEQLRENLKQSPMPDAAIDKLIELGAAIHSGAMREDYDRHPPEKMGKIKLADFAAEFAARFAEI